MSFLDFMNYELFDFVSVKHLFISALIMLVAYLIFGKKGLIAFIKYLFRRCSMSIKYRTNSNYDSSKVDGQTFETMKPIYRLNKATNQLEATGEFVDIPELIQSDLPSTLSNILDMFLNPCKVSDDVAEQTNMQGDIDFLQEAYQVAEEYRAKYNLSSDLSFAEIFSVVETKKKELDEKIKNEQLVLETKNRLEKEAKKSEKENV